MINIGDTFGPWQVHSHNGIGWMLTSGPLVIHVHDHTTPGDSAAGASIVRLDAGPDQGNRRNFSNLAAALEALRPVSDAPPDPWSLEGDSAMQGDGFSTFEAVLTGDDGWPWPIRCNVSERTWHPHCRPWRSLGEQIRLSEALTALGKWCQAKRNAYVVQP